MGRPSSYSEDIADRICAELANGAGLRDICEPAGMPAPSTIYRWLSEFPEFQERYARARERQADTYADEIVGISDNENGDPQRDRLRIDARKWVASKLRPKKYGERVLNELTGSDGGPLVYANMNPEVRDQRIQELWAKRRQANTESN